MPQTSPTPARKVSQRPTRARRGDKRRSSTSRPPKLGIVAERSDPNGLGEDSDQGFAERVELPGPKERLGALFDLLQEIALAGEAVLVGTPNAIEPPVRFDLSMLMRAINTLKGVRILLESSHWELASAGARQLFELLVNIEYIGSRPDRDKATLRYTKFGLLQVALHELKSIEYDAKTGRAIDKVRKVNIEKLLDQGFKEFSKPKGRWATSWSGKNTWQLAKLSKRPLRQDQYRLLFGPWSEQTHGSPGSVIPNLFGRLDEDGFEGAILKEDRVSVELASMAVSLTIEIWQQLPYAAPLDPAKAASWLARLRAIAPRQ